MREAKLRVEQTTFNNGTTAYYGNVIIKKVVEDYHIAEFDKRKDIAPCGVSATIAIDRSHNDIDGNKIDEKDVLDIKISASYLDYEAENRYLAFFHIDGKVYEVCVWYEKDTIKAVSLSEWESYGSFEDGDDADNIYWGDEHFICVEPYIC
jgi:hypothetical protein